jgi:hypothetical protein
MKLTDFNSTVQQAFKEAMAVAAGLPSNDTGCVTLKIYESSRRILSVPKVEVDVTISMQDGNMAELAALSLTNERINAGLAAMGLPAATITSAVTVLKDMNMPVKNNTILQLMQSISPFTEPILLTNTTNVSLSANTTPEIISFSNSSSFSGLSLAGQIGIGIAVTVLLGLVVCTIVYRRSTCSIHDRPCSGDDTANMAFVQQV